MNVKIEELAERLYNARIEIALWTKLFTLDELKTLWKGCQADLDIGYDDEIYEALKLLGYFKVK